MALAIYSMKSKESESLINGKYKLTITIPALSGVFLKSKNKVRIGKKNG